MVDTTYAPKTYHKQGGDEFVVASGGQITIESGGILSVNGVDVTAGVAAAAANPVVGVAAGYKLARGELALDGSNPTSVAHGLTTCIAVTATLKGSAAPGAGTSVITAVINGANLDFYAWKPTTGGASGNPDLIASTGTESIYFVAVGT